MSNFQNPQATIGVGLRSKHIEYFLTDIPQITAEWLEVHPENYLHDYTKRKKLRKISEKLPISFHCVSLSLGSPQLPDKEHLRHIKQLMKEINPFLFSDHLSWSNFNNYGYNDLFPLPMTEVSLQRMAMHVRVVQDFFGRQILIENPSTYLVFRGDTITEYEFLNSLSELSGCGILLDVNNIYVQSINCGVDVDAYLKNINWDVVQEVHLAGHVHHVGEGLVIDTHSQPVSDEVWELYRKALRYKSKLYSLIEWDSDVQSGILMCRSLRCY